MPILLILQMLRGAVVLPSTPAQSATPPSTATQANTTQPNTTTPPVTGVPPTPTPAFPGLPVPPLSSGLPSGTPPQPLPQELRTPISLTPSQVADLQTRLVADGFYHGPIDGVLNGSTRSGIRAFQEAARLPATGEPDAVTTSAIGVSSPAAAAATFGTPFPLNSPTQGTIFIQP
jgi:hypothetical protein